jgi:hypothetical protein
MNATVTMKEEVRTIAVTLLLTLSMKGIFSP